MADLVLFTRRFLEYRDSMYHEGLIDQRFIKFVQSASRQSWDFPLTRLRLFCDGNHEYLVELTNEFAKPDAEVDFNIIRNRAQIFNIGSNSFGAKKLHDVGKTLWRYILAEDLSGCRRSMRRVSEEFTRVRNRFEHLIVLGNQIIEAGGRIPIAPWGPRM